MLIGQRCHRVASSEIRTAVAAAGETSGTSHAALPTRAELLRPKSGPRSPLPPREKPLALPTRALPTRHFPRAAPRAAGETSGTSYAGETSGTSYAGGENSGTSYDGETSGTSYGALPTAHFLRQHFLRHFLRHFPRRTSHGTSHAGRRLPAFAARGRHRPEPGRRHLRHPPRPLVEPGRRGSGHRPRPPHRPGSPRHRDPHGRARHHRGSCPCTTRNASSPPASSTAPPPPLASTARIFSTSSAKPACRVTTRKMPAKKESRGALKARRRRAQG
jgi:hypothetical protein